MNRTKIFYITALICNIFILFFYSSLYFKPVYSTQEDTGVSFFQLTNGWSYQDETKQVVDGMFPKSVRTDEQSSATLTTILPAEITASDVLQFHTSHCNVWVYVDDTLIYENTAKAFTISKTPGSVSHFIRLSPDMAGKSLSITYQNCYGGDSIHLYKILFGNEKDILYHLIVSKLPAFVICALMFAIGVICLLCYMIFRKQLSSSFSLLWLALFAITFSCWSGFETQMMVIMFPYHLAFSWFTFVSLKFISIPIIVFVAYTYQNKPSRWSDFLVALSGIDILGTCILQYCGILDFKETLWFTHFIFLLTILWIFILFISKIHAMRNHPSSPSILPSRSFSLNQLHIVFIPALAVTVILDFASYYFMLNEDSARFSRIALMFYIVALAFMIVQNALDLQKRKEREEALREMASTDPLTKLKNRTSFEKDIASISKKEQLSYGIAMFDLNKLKYFNDVHGHSMGDYYIIICSEILQDIFCSYGNIYRIGGDEFCAVLKDISMKEYEQLSPLIASRLNALHQPIFEYHMEVADGYALFDTKQDHSLLNTMERADVKMYTKKQKMKAAAEKKQA